MLVDDVMTRDVVVVRPEIPLREVARLLAARGVSGLPVVDGRGSVLGVVSEADVLARVDGVARSRPRLLSLLSPSGRDEVRRKLSARTAGEAMTRPAVTIGASASTSAAAALMVSRGVNRLPVVGEARRLVGIVARSDLVRAFARPDAEVEEEIRELLVRVLSVPPDAVRVRVSSGDVAFSGCLETPALEELLIALAQQLPGVLSVESTLSHAHEDPQWPSERLFAGSVG
jgi:CBS domain-containing protein